MGEQNSDVPLLDLRGVHPECPARETGKQSDCRCADLWDRDGVRTPPHDH